MQSIFGDPEYILNKTKIEPKLPKIRGECAPDAPGIRGWI